MKTKYNDRLHAGHILAGSLNEYKNSGAIILAVPRGGVPIAYVVAKELQLQMDLILTKKIGIRRTGNTRSVQSVSMAVLLILQKMCPDHI